MSDTSAYDTILRQAIASILAADDSTQTVPEIRQLLTSALEAHRVATEAQVRREMNYDQKLEAIMAAQMAAQADLDLI